MPATDIIRTLQARDRLPRLDQAIGEFGRISKNLQMPTHHINGKASVAAL